MARIGRQALVFSFLVVLSIAIGACGGGTSSPATPASTEMAPTATPAPTPTVSLTPNGNRILGDVKQLADAIGPRPAGSDREKQAADFIAFRLRGLGYEVTLQEFPINTQSARGSSLSVVGSDQKTIASVPFEQSGVGSVRARLVAAGIGRPDEFPPETKGSIVLIERGELFFTEKVANAQSAGARGLILFNNEAGLFYGRLERQAAIPALVISQAEGRSLADTLARGAVEVELTVAAPASAVSRNVVAKPPGRECDTVSGGHYDSVAQAPGASDNASGASTVLEIAAVLASRGEMGGNCFVLFGAEEIGLVGSRAFVASLDADARQHLKAMLNFDMVGVGEDGWLLIGSPELQQKGQAAATALGIAVARGALPTTTSSDHASFMSAGIPTLMFFRLTDNLLHTPQDVSDRVRPDLLEQAGRMGLAVLQALSAG